MKALVVFLHLLLFLSVTPLSVMGAWPSALYTSCGKHLAQPAFPDQAWLSVLLNFNTPNNEESMENLKRAIIAGRERIAKSRGDIFDVVHQPGRIFFEWSDSGELIITVPEPNELKHVSTVLSELMAHPFKLQMAWSVASFNRGEPSKAHQIKHKDYVGERWFWWDFLGGERPRSLRTQGSRVGTAQEFNRFLKTLTSEEDWSSGTFYLEMTPSEVELFSPYIKANRN